jgi:gamma-butyrobetaine dioxygenase
VPAAINAAYTSHDLGFHTDLLYFQHPPHIQLLHCLQSASTGGASVFADAYKAAIDLFHMDQDAFEVLTTLPVNYHYNHPDSNIYRTTKPVIDLYPLRVGTELYSDITAYKAACHKHSLENGGPGWSDAMLIPCMDKINWGPPFLAPFSLHQQQAYNVGYPGKGALPMLNGKVERWHRAARKFNTLLQRPEYLYERKMNPGECVLFDNTRTLHSRRAFNAGDVGKARWLKGTYVDKDPFFSKIRVLERKYR